MRLPSRSQQTQAEQEEEYITNKLMKRLDELKKEKEHLARQVEMEEENITNKLSKKLEKVKQEKVGLPVPVVPLWQVQELASSSQVNLENLLEQEQEYIVNKLQKQVTAARRKRPCGCARPPRPSAERRPARWRAHATRSGARPPRSDPAHLRCAGAPPLCVHSWGRCTRRSGRWRHSCEKVWQAGSALGAASVAHSDWGGGSGPARRCIRPRRCCSSSPLAPPSASSDRAPQTFSLFHPHPPRQAGPGAATLLPPRPHSRPRRG